MVCVVSREVAAVWPPWESTSTVTPFFNHCGELLAPGHTNRSDLLFPKPVQKLFRVLGGQFQCGFRYDPVSFKGSECSQGADEILAVPLPQRRCGYERRQLSERVEIVRSQKIGNRNLIPLAPKGGKSFRFGVK